MNRWRRGGQRKEAIKYVYMLHKFNKYAQACLGYLENQVTVLHMWPVLKHSYVILHSLYNVVNQMIDYWHVTYIKYIEAYASIK